MEAPANGDGQFVRRALLPLGTVLALVQCAAVAWPHSSDPAMLVPWQVALQLRPLTKLQERLVGVKPHLTSAVRKRCVWSELLVSSLHLACGVQVHRVLEVHKLLLPAVPKIPKVAAPDRCAVCLHLVRMPSAPRLATSQHALFHSCWL